METEVDGVISGLARRVMVEGILKSSTAREIGRRREGAEVKQGQKTPINPSLNSLFT